MGLTYYCRIPSQACNWLRIGTALLYMLRSNDECSSPGLFGKFKRAYPSLPRTSSRVLKCCYQDEVPFEGHRDVTYARFLIAHTSIVQLGYRKCLLVGHVALNRSLSEGPSDNQLMPK